MARFAEKPFDGPSSKAQTVGSSPGSRRYSCIGRANGRARYTSKPKFMLLSDENILDQASRRQDSGRFVPAQVWEEQGMTMKAEKSESSQRRTSSMQDNSCAESESSGIRHCAKERLNSTTSHSFCNPESPRLPPSEPVRRVIDKDAVRLSVRLDPVNVWQALSAMKFDARGCCDASFGETEKALKGRWPQDSETLEVILGRIQSGNAASRVEGIRRLTAILLMARAPMPTNDSSHTHLAFGVGLEAFYEIAVLGHKIPQHLQNALHDDVPQVQLAALHCFIALVDGASAWAAEGAQLNKATTNNWKATWDAASRLDWLACLRSPLDASSEILRRRFSPHCAADLRYWRHCTPSSWEHLLQEREVMRQKGNYLSNKPSTELSDPLRHVFASGALEQCMGSLSMGKGDLELWARCLSAVAAFDATSCSRVMALCRPYSHVWIQRLDQHFELLKLIRVTCEVGGRSAAQVWLEDHAIVSVIRGVLLDAVSPLGAGNGAPPATGPIWRHAGQNKGATNVCTSNGASTATKAVREIVREPVKRLLGVLRAVEVLRLWRVWLCSGVGIDAVDTVIPTLCGFMSLLPERDVDDKLGAAQWLLGAQIWRFIGAIFEADEPQQPLLVGLSAAALVRTGAAGKKSAGQTYIVDRCEHDPILETAQRLVGAWSCRERNCPFQNTPQLICLTELTAAIAKGLDLHTNASRFMVLRPTVESIFDLDLHSRLLHIQPVVTERDVMWPMGTVLGPQLLHTVGLQLVAELCRLQAASAVAWGQYSTATYWLKDLLQRIKALPLAHIEVWCGVVEAALEAQINVANSRPQLNDPRLEMPAGLLAQSLRCCRCARTSLRLFELGGIRLSCKARQALLCAAIHPESPWSELCTEAKSMSISLPSAAFWVLMSGPSLIHAREILQLFVEPFVSQFLKEASAPWLPFIALCSFLNTPLGSADGSVWAWQSVEFRKMFLGPPKLLETFLSWIEIDQWLRSMPQSLMQTLSAECDSLVSVFTAVPDALLAKVLATFALPRMPHSCRMAVLGHGDPTLALQVAQCLDEGCEVEVAPCPFLECPSTTSLRTPPISPRKLGSPQRSWNVMDPAVSPTGSPRRSRTLSAMELLASSMKVQADWGSRLGIWEYSPQSSGKLFVDLQGSTRSMKSNRSSQSNRSRSGSEQAGTPRGSGVQLFSPVVNPEGVQTSTSTLRLWSPEPGKTHDSLIRSRSISLCRHLVRHVQSQPTQSRFVRKGQASSGQTFKMRSKPRAGQRSASPRPRRPDWSFDISH